MESSEDGLHMITFTSFKLHFGPFVVFSEDVGGSHRGVSYGNQSLKDESRDKSVCGVSREKVTN